jgi:hypothetical protein
VLCYFLLVPDLTEFGEFPPRKYKVEKSEGGGRRRLFNRFGHWLQLIIVIASSAGIVLVVILILILILI